MRPFANTPEYIKEVPTVVIVTVAAYTIIVCMAFLAVFRKVIR
jgi:hypothetical protein